MKNKALFWKLKINEILLGLSIPLGLYLVYMALYWFGTFLFWADIPFEFFKNGEVYIHTKHRYVLEPHPSGITALIGFMYLAVSAIILSVLYVPIKAWIESNKSYIARYNKLKKKGHPFTYSTLGFREQGSFKANWNHFWYLWDCISHYKGIYSLRNMDLTHAENEVKNKKINHKKLKY